MDVMQEIVAFIHRAKSQDGFNRRFAFVVASLVNMSTPPELLAEWLDASGR